MRSTNTIRLCRSPSLNTDQLPGDIRALGNQIYANSPVAHRYCQLDSNLPDQPQSQDTYPFSGA